MSRSNEARDWAVGGLALAAAPTIMLGLRQIFAAIADDGFFAAAPNYAYPGAGAGHPVGDPSRHQQLSLPAEPSIWPVAVIALAGFVIWSLATTSRQDLDTDTTTHTADRNAYR